MSFDFNPYRTILFETYRKDGTTVNTPLWFVPEGNTLYVRTDPTTGKAKRLRRDPRARVAGADSAENPATAWVDATTRFVEGEEATRMYDKLDARYNGAFKRADSRRDGEIVVIAIELPG